MMWCTRDTKGGSITVLLTSCLTGLDKSILQIKTKIVNCHTADSEPFKWEVNSTVILPLQHSLGACMPWQCMHVLAVAHAFPGSSTCLLFLCVNCIYITPKQLTKVSLEHRYGRSPNRLLKVCYVPASSAVLIAFFSSQLLLRPLTVLMKQTRQPVHTIKQSIYLDVYGLESKTRHCVIWAKVNWPNVIKLTCNGNVSWSKCHNW